MRTAITGVCNQLDCNRVVHVKFVGDCDLASHVNQACWYIVVEHLIADGSVCTGSDKSPRQLVEFEDGDDTNCDLSQQIADWAEPIELVTEEAAELEESLSWYDREEFVELQECGERCSCDQCCEYGTCEYRQSVLQSH
jgi:hypothetical protein